MTDSEEYKKMLDRAIKKALRKYKDDKKEGYLHLVQKKANHDTFTYDEVLRVTLYSFTEGYVYGRLDEAEVTL